MPIYEYLCSGCGKRFSLLQSIHVGTGETDCPECKSFDVRKIPSTFSSAAGDSFGSGEVAASSATSSQGSGSCCGGGCCGM